jgi:aldose sugar dehydrogenase
MKRLVLSPLLSLGFALLAPPAEAQVAGARDARTLYTQLCASCHGPQMQGGQASSLLDATWTTGSDEATIMRVIARGVVEKGMPAFGETVSEQEQRALARLIREENRKALRQGATAPQPKRPAAGARNSEEHRYVIETVADNLATPWGIAFLPDGRMLFTEKPGRVRVVVNGILQEQPVRGTPAVRDEGQGGLMEVAVHPKYTENGWIYLAYSDPAKSNGRDVSLTTIVRGRLKNNAWTDQETIWKAPLEFYRPGGGVHFGCRIAFDREGFLYFTHGERGAKEHAQELRRPNGKVHRIHDDGRIPADNPFVGTADAFKSIWTYGNRNPQGLDFDPRTGFLWESEHGPRGGDELNLIERGKNYGWPVITYGINYNGTKITDLTHKEGMEQPVVQWTPSIAVCGIDFYDGDAFPKWKHNLFVTALAFEELRRVVIEGRRVTHQEVIFKNMGRLRDVETGPDGFLYVAVNGPDKIIRLRPAD